MRGSHWDRARTSTSQRPGAPLGRAAGLQNTNRGKSLLDILTLVRSFGASLDRRGRHCRELHQAALPGLLLINLHILLRYIYELCTSGPAKDPTKATRAEPPDLCTRGPLRDVH